MPIPFKDACEDSGSGVVAWLRFTHERDGMGVQAALFETSGDSKPLAFFFTRIDWRDPSLHDTENPTRTALVRLAEALFRSAVPSPALVIGSDDDLTRMAFTDDIRVTLPFCQIKVTRNGQVSSSWITKEPAPASEARRLFEEVMARDTPWEPYDRTDDALNEAFADERIQAMVSVGGVMSVVSLLSLPERLEHLDDAHPEERESGSPRVLTLAERLWMKLAARTLETPYNQLSWPGEFMPFQKDGIAMLLHNDRLLLADDMGLGKTVQAIAAIRILCSRNEIKSCLVVAPASLLSQWRRELDKWAPELSAIIVEGSAAERSWKWPAKKMSN